MRSIASLSLSFGLVSIPVRLYSVVVPAAALRFKWMSAGGARLRQRYVASALPEPFSQEPDAAVNGADEDTVAPSPQPTARASSPRAAIAAPMPADDDADDVRAIEAPPAPLPRPGSEQVGDEIGRSGMVKGYEYERGKFVLFTPAELDALRAQRRDSIDIVAFVPDGAVDPIYHDKTYLLAPDRRGERTYSLLLRALQRSGRSALARWAW
jgi:non-homologous end joining protein Ku